MKKGYPLQAGDTIGLFVPASPVKENHRHKGLNRIKKLGYRCLEVDNILSCSGFVAKSARENMADIQLLFDNNNVKALWAARGGYGSNHILPYLSQLSIQNAKIVVGSSDVSYILWYLMDNFKMVVFYGPMAFASMADDRVDLKNLQQMLSGDYTEVRVPGQVLVPGQCQAVVSGGCLSNLVSLIGTPFFPDLHGKIVLLEDTNERPYRLDRMVWQLAENGIFKEVSGILLGQFPGCFLTDDEKNEFLLRIKDYFLEAGYPVLYDLPFGHGSAIHTLPLGIPIEINTRRYDGIIIREKGVKV